MTAVKTRFKTPEQSRTLLREWDSLSLTKIMDLYSGRDPSFCMELLIGKLSDIQYSLLQECHREAILRKRILNAAKDVEACKLAYHRPADTIQGVISDNHGSLATLKTSRTRLDTPL